MSTMCMTSVSVSDVAGIALFTHHYNKIHLKCRVNASSSSSSAAAAAPSVDLKPLRSAIDTKDSNAVREALNELSELGWAKKWSSQPYVSRRTTSLRELTTLGVKNAENLAIPSVRNDWWEQLDS